MKKRLKKYIHGPSSRDFLKMSGERAAIIDSADPSCLKNPSEYPANRLAEELHPSNQRLVVSDVLRHESGVVSYVLVPDRETGSAPAAYFSAGMYLSVKVEIDGKIYTRPYSIASAPSQALAGSYMISVEPKEGGRVSRYITENWKEGTKTETSAPLGTFGYDELRDCADIVAAAGGTGITPFRSMAADFVERYTAGRISRGSFTLIYGTSGEKNILYKDFFETLTEKCSAFRVVYVLNDEELPGYEHGVISAGIIRKYAPAGEYTLFACGPQALYDYLRDSIAELGIPAKNYRPEMSAVRGSSSLSHDRVHKITVNMGSSGCVSLECPEDVTLLCALEEAAVPVRAHCRSGKCGYCRMRLVSGNIFISPDNDGRRLADKKYGYIHPCASFPLSDLEIAFF